MPRHLVFRAFVGSTVLSVLCAGALALPIAAQLQPLAPQPSKLRPPASTPRAPKPTLLPTVTIDGEVRPNSKLVIRTKNVGATANGRRAKMVRVNDGMAQDLEVASWKEGEVVVRIPEKPFGSGPGAVMLHGELLIGLCGSSGSWVGSPVRTAFASRGALVVRKPARPCTNPDEDGDGSDSQACGGADCDDADPRRAPGRPEICDAAMLDEDCDVTTSGSRDADGDGSIDAACCNVDASGGRVCGNDCDDQRPGVSRTVPEVCDGLDNDCDGGTDEGVQHVLWRDRDGDGFGDPAETQFACSWSPGLSYVGNDCNDNDPNAFKGHGCN